MDFLLEILSVLWQALFQFTLPTCASGYLGVLLSKLFVSEQNPKRRSAWVRMFLTLLGTGVLTYALLLLGSSRYSLWGPASEFTVTLGTATAAICNFVMSLRSLLSYHEPTVRKTVVNARDIL